MAVARALQPTRRAVVAFVAVKAFHRPVARGNLPRDVHVVQRSHDTMVDLDLDLAREQSSENPVYYVQYAHARIASILKKAGWKTVEAALAEAAAYAGELHSSERMLAQRDSKDDQERRKKNLQTTEKLHDLISTLWLYAWESMRNSS